MSDIENAPKGVNDRIVAVCNAAKEAVAAGLCIIPPSEDGQKRPMPDNHGRDGRWDHFKKRRPTDQEIRTWYPRRSGIGLVAGAISGNTEPWDFDDRATYEAYVSAARAAGLGHIIDRIEAGYCDDTAGSGVRWLVRYPDGARTEFSEDREIMARRPKTPEELTPSDKEAIAKAAEKGRKHTPVKILIEMTRYSILAPSNGRVHPTGRAYERRSGGFSTITQYSAEERQALIDLARSFDGMPRLDAERAPPKSSKNEIKGTRPGDDYNARTTWEDVLVGWTRLRTLGGVTYWRRPGKKFGVSATTNFGGHDKLHVFTTSTEFDPDKNYSRFAAYVAMEHGGDYSAAAKALAKAGYGKKPVIERRGAAADGAAADASDDGPEYRATKTGMEWLKRTPSADVWVPLANFNATIVTEVTLDDDVEPRKDFEIEATLHGRKYRFTVPAAQFSSMNWVAENLGARAYVEPGQATAKRAAVAIQVLSGDVPERTIYTSTGWKKIGDAWVYLHAGGAIGPKGTLPDIDVDLPKELSPFILPDPDDGKKLQEAVRESISLINLAPDLVSVNGLGCTYRSVLGSIDMSSATIGPTGNFKTAFAVLLQQHFGAGFDSSHIIANWSSTANHLEEMAFFAKDALLLVDEFMPGQVTADRLAYQSKAERVLRNAGNQGGRGRMGKDRRLIQSRPPRGLIYITGEEVPEGASLRARMAISEIQPGAIDAGKLTAAQQKAGNGVYALAMAGFIKWIALQYDDVQAAFRENVRVAREKARTADHKRTATVLAQLMAAWNIFLTYAVDIEALTDDGALRIRDRVWTALLELGSDQTALQDESDPVSKFRELILSSLRMAKAHLVSTNDPTQPPPKAERLGWVEYGTADKTGEVLMVPKGWRIGWADESFLYLEPAAAFKAANDLSVGGLGVGKNKLARELVNQKVTLRTERRGGKRRLDWRLSLANGDRVPVWVVNHTLDSVFTSVPSVPSVPQEENIVENQNDN